jgi:hypothetical protein
VGRYRSLVGQGQETLPDVDAFGCLRSLRARSALDGVSWVRMVEIKMAEPSSAFVSGDVEQGKFSPFPLIPARTDGRLSPDRRSFD